MYVLVYWTEYGNTSIILEEDLDPNKVVGEITSAKYLDGSIYEARIMAKSYDREYLENLTVSADGETMAHKRQRLRTRKFVPGGPPPKQTTRAKSSTCAQDARLLEAPSIFDGIQDNYDAPGTSQQAPSKKRRRLNRDRQDDGGAHELENEARRDREVEEKRERIRRIDQERENQRQRAQDEAQRLDTERERQRAREEAQRLEAERERQRAREEEQRFSWREIGRGHERNKNESNKGRARQPDGEDGIPGEVQLVQNEDGVPAIVRRRPAAVPAPEQVPPAPELVPAPEPVPPAPELVPDYRHAGAGRVQLCNVYNVWIDAGTLTFFSRYWSNPKELTRKLLRSLLGDAALTNMCARGRATDRNRRRVPEEVMNSVEYYVNKKCSRRLEPVDFTNVTNMMCASLRNPRR
ncbi:hypothetical protein QAD02_011252 [Eretmocerus hayati]|uniref:Uncharacterized protein n=1 Tax=Eretmocerus hayati TaxID=131215 RepID=A0ACC2NXD3_9HYME|nr:hypothetical protein QAD02_011252 [Eretmocerus hayati]